MSDIIQRQIEAYRPNFLKHGDSPKGTFQNNTETQYLRFAKLLENLPIERGGEFSIHDVGSGMCDLHKFLLEQNINHAYSGTEVVQEMIDIAKKKFPEIKLFNRDLLSVTETGVYDFVVLSGTFNLPSSVPQTEWKEFCEQVIVKMFDLAKKGIAFNFLTTESTFTDPTLFYFSPSEALTFCQKNLSRFVFVDHAYPLYEFTVTVLKKTPLKDQYAGEAFEKYFKN